MFAEFLRANVTKAKTKMTTYRIIFHEVNKVLGLVRNVSVENEAGQCRDQQSPKIVKAKHSQQETQNR